MKAVTDACFQGSRPCPALRAITERQGWQQPPVFGADRNPEFATENGNVLGNTLSPATGGPGLSQAAPSNQVYLPCPTGQPRRRVKRCNFPAILRPSPPSGFQSSRRRVKRCNRDEQREPEIVVILSILSSSSQAVQPWPRGAVRAFAHPHFQSSRRRVKRCNWITFGCSPCSIMSFNPLVVESRSATLLLRLPSFAKQHNFQSSRRRVKECNRTSAGAGWRFAGQLSILSSSSQGVQLVDHCRARTALRNLSILSSSSQGVQRRTRASSCFAS